MVRIDFHLSVAFPLLLLQFHHQVYPFVGQFPKSFVIGKLLSHLRQALGAHEERSALAPPGETEVVIRSVLLGILGIFTTTVRLAADVVLLAQATRMDGPQLGELLFQVLDLACDMRGIHCRYHYNDIGYCQALSSNFLVFSSAGAIATLPPLLLAIQFRHEHEANDPVYETFPSSGCQRN